jgi:hypothetical protein
MPAKSTRRLVHIPSHHNVYAVRRSPRLRKVLPAPDHYHIKKVKGKYYRIPCYYFYFPLHITRPQK